jgi:predicted HTH transcriptional regulator
MPHCAVYHIPTFRRKRARDLARAFCDVEPGIEIPTEYVPVDETHQAIVCRVVGGPHKPYAYDGRPYRRVQSTTTKMPQEQYAAQEWQLKVGETGEVNREVNVGTNGTKDGTKKPEEDANGVNDGDKKGLDAINCGTNVGTKDDESGTKEDGSGTNGEANGHNECDDDELLIENVRNEPNLSLEELAERLHVSRRTVARMVDHLKAQGRIRRVGGTRGHWET